MLSNPDRSGFDLLHTYIVMPKFDGIALAPKVAKDYPDLKGPMMTSYTHEHPKVLNFHVLTEEVIPKPLAFHQMRETTQQTFMA